MRLPTHEASSGFLLLVTFSVKITARRTCRSTDDASHRLVPALRPTTEEPPATAPHGATSSCLNVGTC